MPAAQDPRQESNNSLQKEIEEQDAA